MFCVSSQAKNYSEALQWYNYSLSFFKAGQMEPNSAKLQRNRASCFLQLKQLEKVGERQSIYCQVVAVDGMSQNSPYFLQFICDVCLHVNTWFFFRRKKQLKKQRDVILTTFSLSSVFTRLQCRRTMWRKVSTKCQLCATCKIKAVMVTVSQFHCSHIFSIFSVVMRLLICTSCRGSECDGTSVQESCCQ